MCIIFACYKSFPSMKVLEKAAERNQHGAGIAWWDEKDKIIRFEKGLKSDPAALEPIIKKIRHHPTLIHFRIASVGGIDPDLTHPFPIEPDASLRHSGTSKAVLMHNGHWFSWKETFRDFCLRHKLEPPPGLWSDSRAIAFIAAHMGKRILPFLTDKDRIAVITSDGRWETIGEWHEPNDIGESGYLMSLPMTFQCSTKSYPNTTEPEWYQKGKGQKAKGAESTRGENLSVREKAGEGQGEGGKETPKAGEKDGKSPGGGSDSNPLVLLLPSGESPVTPAGTSTTTPSPAPSSQKPSQPSSVSELKRSVSLTREERLSLEESNWSLADVTALFEEVKKKNGLRDIPQA